MFTVAVASAVLALAPCDDGKLSRADVERQILVDVLPSPTRVTAVAEAIRSGNAKLCHQILADFVSGIQKNVERKEFLPVRTLMLALAAKSQVPGALDVVQREIEISNSDEFLEILREASPRRYEAALKTWVANAARQVVTTAKETNASSRVMSPLFLERYLRLMTNSKTPFLNSDYQNLNIIFVNTKAGHREIFLPLYGEAFRKNAHGWILSFRSSEPSVQFRLFPIFEAIGGPEVVKELMWISKNHPDVRFRSLAEQSLNYVLNPQPNK